MNVLCRGCRTEIDLNAGVCPICLRPRDRSEMLEDAKRLREAQAAAKARPYKILGAVLLLGALGYAGWRWRGPVLGALSTLRAKAGAVMDHASDPKTYAPGVASGVPEATPPSAPPPSAPAPASPSQAPGAPASSAPGAPAAEPAATEPARDWTLPPAMGSTMAYSILLRGWVYDLVTARPIPFAKFRLQDRLSGAPMQVQAREDGYYEIHVTQQNSGLEVRAETGGYRPEPVEENDPPWHDRKAAARLKAASRQPGDMLLTFTPNQEEAVVNVVLVPLPKR